ncbi:hypothetical protein ACRRTK_024024 [Alexandromys fortis]
MATVAPICTRYTNASHSRLFAENLQLSNKSLRSTHKLDWPQEVMWIPSMNVNFLLWFVRSERSAEQSSLWSCRKLGAPGEGGVEGERQELRTPLSLPQPDPQAPKGQENLY